MSVRELAVIAAAAVFTFASMGVVNLSEVINVKLPAQYDTIVDQAPLTGISVQSEADRGPVRLHIEAPNKPDAQTGPFARVMIRHLPSRG